ncbi:ATP-binding protein [Pedobacter sp. GSP4]|uniref:GAF domain-containing sensor histidine kinase n=1 Tax=Pedobacter sp. GSP4 TaxID=3453716 RepID=UPI003EE90220
MDTVEQPIDFSAFFMALDEAACILERTSPGRTLTNDYRYIAANPAYQRLPGISGIIGESIKRDFPTAPQLWFEQFEKTVQTGEAQRVTYEIPSESIKLEVSVSRLGDENRQRLMMVFRDVTGHSLHQQQGYLLRMSDALRPLKDPQQIRWVAIQLIGSHLGASRAFYSSVLKDGEALLIGPEYCDGLTSLPATMSLSNFIPSAIDAGSTLVIEDILRDNRFTSKAKSVFREIGTRSAVAVPLVKNGILMAMVGVHYIHPRQWTVTEIALIEDVCTRIWQAAEQAAAEKKINDKHLAQLGRLEQEVAERTAELATANSYLDRYEEKLRAYVTASSELVYQMSADWKQMWALESKNFLRNTLDAHQEWLERYIPIEEQPRVMAAVNMAIALKTMFELEHRVIMANGKIGWTHSRAVPLMDEDGNIREWFGVASNITAKKEAEENLKKLRAAQQKEIFRITLSTLEEERRRFAESLHNGLGQILYGIKINISGMTAKLAVSDPVQYDKNREYALQLLLEAMRDTRRISHQLMPTSLNDFGLKVALEDTCRQMQDGVRFDCKIELGGEELEEDIQLAVFRTAQELMLNVLKHAGATNASVNIRIESGNIVIEVSDNGRGMNQKNRTGIGLASIESKADLLNGGVEITSGEKIGTTVRVSWPVADEHEEISP